MRRFTTKEAFLRPARIFDLPEDPDDQVYIEEQIRLSQQRFAEEQAEKADEMVRSAIRKIKEIAHGPLCASVANIRVDIGECLNVLDSRAQQIGFSLVIGRCLHGRQVRLQSANAATDRS